MMIESDGLNIDRERKEVIVSGSRVELTRVELGLLVHLAENPGQIFTRRELIDAVRGKDCPSTAQSVDVQIMNLRKKLGPLHDCIETIRGVGYRFRESPC